MAPPTVPLAPPSRLVAGDSVVWDVAPIVDPALGTFDPADSWQLDVYLSTPDAQLSATASVSGAYWRVTFTAAQTAGIAYSDPPDPLPIPFWYVVSKDSDRFTVLRGVLTLEPNPATSGANAVKFALDMVTVWREALVAFSANQAITSYTIGDRSVQRSTPAQMRAELEYWERRLSDAKRAAAGSPQGFGRRVQWRMTGVSA